MSEEQVRFTRRTLLPRQDGETTIWSINGFEILQQGEPGTVQGAIQYPLQPNGERIYKDRNEDEEPGTVLSCVICGFNRDKNKTDGKNRKCRTD